MRYPMGVVPYTWAQVQGMHSGLMNCARKGCGLSRCASTLFMMTDKGSYGVGVESAFHTYVNTTVESLRALQQDDGDRGRMARGLWRAYDNLVVGGRLDSTKLAGATQLPMLHMRAQMEECGVRVLPLSHAAPQSPWLAALYPPTV